MTAASPRSIVHWGLPVLLALAASGAVLLDLTLRGPMRWHFSRPEAVQGGIEALVLATALALLAWRGGRWCWIAMALAGGLYLRRHHVDLPLLGAVVAAEVLVAWGMLLLGERRDGHPLWLSLQALAAGLMLWLAAMLAMHAAWMADPAWLLALFAAAGAAALAVRRRSAVWLPGLSAFAAAPRAQRAMWALLGSWFLVLLARSNSVIGFDTLWYPTRGSAVLAPNGSFFEPLGLVSAVHYFPKLWELLLLPFDAIGDFSFAAAFALLLMSAALALCALLLGRLGVRGALLPLALLVLATLPAIASTALQLKTDIAAWFFFMLALVAAAEWSERRTPDLLVWTFIGVGLAACAKLTVLPYGALLLLSVGWAALRQRSRADWAAAGREFGLVAALVLCLGIGLTMLYRTWALAGVPTIGPDPLLALWRLFGMELREPAGSLSWLRPQDWGDAPWLLPEALFAPNGLPKIRIGWTGNAWLLAAGLALYWSRAHRDNRTLQQTRLLRRTLHVLALAGLGLLLFWQYHSRGSDGNYFIVPVVSASILAFAAAARAARWPFRRLGLAALLAICAVWQGALGFVSAAWSPPGTRPLDLRFDRSTFDTDASLQRRRRAAGLEQIDRWLAGAPADARTLAAGPSEAVHLLPTRVESLEHVLASRPAYGRSVDGFVRYLRLACIDYVLVSSESSPAVNELMQQTSSTLPHEMVGRTAAWTLYAIDPCGPEHRLTEGPVDRSARSAPPGS